MIKCKNKELYRRGEKVKLLVYHSPIAEVGSIGKVLNRWVGALYAVQLSNGEIYKWLALHDLSEFAPNRHRLRVGDLAVINSDRHHHRYHPFLKSGSLVRILKVLEETDYYELEFDVEKCHAYFPGFEVTNEISNPP